MKLLYTACFVLLSLGFAIAQTTELVKWSARFKRISGTEGEIIIKATMAESWSLHTQSSFYPQQFYFIKNTCYNQVGKTIEPEPHKDFYDTLMRMQTRYFEKEVEFKQKIRLLCDKEFDVHIDLAGVVCNDVFGMCVFDASKLNVKIGP